MEPLLQFVEVCKHYVLIIKIINNLVPNNILKTSTISNLLFQFYIPTYHNILTIHNPTRYFIFSISPIIIVYRIEHISPMTGNFCFNNYCKPNFLQEMKKALYNSFRKKKVCIQ